MWTLSAMVSFRLLAGEKVLCFSFLVYVDSEIRCTMGEKTAGRSQFSAAKLHASLRSSHLRKDS